MSLIYTIVNTPLTYIYIGKTIETDTRTEQELIKDACRILQREVLRNEATYDQWGHPFGPDNRAPER